jgi:non-ribosomal peptide synthetase component E (peptide arylation enzyme)
MVPGTPEPDLPAVRDHLESAGLARQKWPEELRFADEFPRTASGKVQKYVLRQQTRAD